MEEHFEGTKKEENNSPLMISGAIIAAGVIIAGAIVATNALPGSPRVPKAPAVLGTELYMDIAKDLGLNTKDFEACLEEERHAGLVEDDLADALEAGGTGTPYNIVIDQQGRPFPFSGAVSYAQLETIVKQALQNSATFGNADSGTARNMQPVDAHDHVRGDLDAPVTIVEFSDLECPFCAQHHPTLARLLANFPDDVRWVYRHFPLESIHPDAFPAAVASECAGELGGNDAFWGFVDAIFTR